MMGPEYRIYACLSVVDIMARLCRDLFEEAATEAARARTVHLEPCQEGNWDGPPTNEDIVGHLRDLYADRLVDALRSEYLIDSGEADFAVEVFVLLASCNFSKVR